MLAIRCSGGKVVAAAKSVSSSQRVKAFGGVRDITTLIMGKPGGGKGTISKKLIKDFNFIHISTGDMLRGHVTRGTDLGKEAKTFMDAGALVPDNLIINMVIAELGNAPKDSRVLLDGFPRTVPQAQELDKNIKIDIALNLDVPNDDIVQRISSRWTHMASGRVYAYDYNPPKVQGIDDESGEPLIQRDDDKPDAVLSRLVAYEEKTAPLCEYYAKQGVFTAFDGEDQPELLAANKRSDAIYKSLAPYLTAKLVELENPEN